MNMNTEEENQTRAREVTTLRTKIIVFITIERFHARID
jgi:hypothetical protein